MSVMLLSDAHINTVASWAAARCAKDHQVPIGGRWVALRESREQVAAALHAANARAFAARYGERVDTSGFRPRALTAAIGLSAGQVFRLLESIIYNSEEAPGWDTSEARQLCDQIIRVCAHCLPGSPGAVWTVDSEAEVRDLVAA